MVNQILLLFSFIIFFSTLMIILAINPIHSIYWLVFIFLLASISLIILGFNFIGLMLIIIYVGAITILFLFVIMMLDILDIRHVTNISHVIFIILMVINIIIINYSNIFKNFYFNIDIKVDPIFWEVHNFSHLELLGLSIYNEYYFCFLILSIILLIGLMSAIILTLDINLKSKKQALYNQHQRNNSWI
uniref:NADH-ubiquinone oxidoreductase chain 6 n=1 Tax=Monoserius pennarius TaxID=2203294 RepID=A0AA96HVX0_9CNID|nr:NADH dehydrogenase subunit 6 [Monoserius pennarius]WNO18777.1 NADH dehydrogenase subunit 6 [Monoserius pennarius]